MAFSYKRCFLIVIMWCWCAWPSANVAAPAVSGKRPAAKAWQVSNYGRCRSSSGVVTNGTRQVSGYLVVGYCGREWLVHRLVLLTFRPLPANSNLECNHLDGNKANNRLDNLEWTTHKQNVRHSHQRLPRRSPGPKLSRPVRCRAVGCSSWTAYDSMTQAAEGLGVSIGSIQRSAVQGRVVKGYECRPAAAKEHVIKGEEWKQMLDPKTGAAISGKMVSSRGRVRTKSGRVLEGSKKNGYLLTTIRLDSEPRGRKVRIHQLVARAFLGPPPSPDHTQVNHKDGNRSNNTVQNLEYATPAQNAAHSYRLTPTRTCSHVKPIESRPFGSSDQWRRHSSGAGAARELGVHGQNVQKCLKGRRKHTGGYEFRYLPSLPDLPGEEWRDIDFPYLLAKRTLRTHRRQATH